VSRWLVVRAATRTIAIPVAVVEEVVELPNPLPVPGRTAAVRGVVPIRGRLLPLASLAAGIGMAEVATHSAGGPGVVLRVAGRRLVLAVDEVRDLVAAPLEALPHGWEGGWAGAALRESAALVPVLDLDWLLQRLDRAADRPAREAEGASTA
jgi:purine-binding chemotaxis protein CheW